MFDFACIVNCFNFGDEIEKLTSPKIFCLIDKVDMKYAWQARLVTGWNMNIGIINSLGPSDASHHSANIVFR